MKTLFAFVVLTTFGAWVALAFVPARNVWNSLGRNFVAQLVLFMAVFGLFHVFVASETNPGWAFARSPCGKSFTRESRELAA